MSPTQQTRAALRDILEAIDEIGQVAGTNAKVTDVGRLQFNALLYSLLKISEAVRHLPHGPKSQRPDLSWDEIARTGNRLRHHYFRVNPTIIADIVGNDLPALKYAIETFRRDLGYGDLPQFG